MPTSGFNRWRLGRWPRVAVWLLVLSAVEMLTGVAPAQTPPPTVRQVQINTGAPQRSMVTTIAVDFSKDVSASLTSASLILLNRTTGQTLNPTNSLMTYDPAANRATWTFPTLVGRSLPDGDYLGTLSAAVIMDDMGNHLDGNGDGTPNDDYTFPFIRYFGDADGDRDVDFIDLFKFRLTFLLASTDPGFNPAFDFNGDGRVDATDLAPFQVNYLTQLPAPVPLVPDYFPVITTPGSLALFNTNRIAISGTVGRSVTYVTVNGAVATLTNGVFTANALLREGNNLVTVVAIDDQGQVGSSTIQVALDVTPPRMTIDSPRDGSIVSEPQAIVTGVVNDTVVGTVNGDQATVSVNGLPASVANRTYVAMAVPLVPGTNVITATGTDRAGNSSSTSVRVFYNTNSAARIKVVSGDGQGGQIGDLLPQPLVVRAVDAGGAPCPNKKVVFKVIQNDGRVINGTNAARALVLTSDSQGLARVQFQLGTRAGAGNQQVSAKIVGFEGEAVFCASARPSTPGLVVLDAGNNQVGIPGQALPSPLVAIVVDSGNNRLHNVPITYTVKSGGGSFGGMTNLTVNTDSDGRALAVLTLGPDAGNDHNLVEATFPGNTGLPVTFVASARIPGNPAETSVSGVVLDNSDQPVPGATLRIVGHPIAARSDANGYFTIKPAPVGTIRLVADGATVTRPGAWVWLQFDLVTIAGQDNDIGRPVRLIAKDMAQAINVDETHGGTLTLRQVPGYSLKIAPNSVLFPDGSRSGQISVTVVHPDKMPDPPSFGQQPRFLISIQPANAVFNPPAPMSIPNLDGLPPGQKTDMYSYDHDMGRFVSIGTGTVSDDGTVISSDLGGGVIKAGWHCGGNPASVAAGLVSQVSLDKTELVLLKGENGTVTATGSPGPPHEPVSFEWQNGGSDLFANLSSTTSTATISGTTAGQFTARVRYRCKSAQWSAYREINIFVVEIHLITPSGDPIAAPRDAGDGQNEFTFSPDTPGVLTIQLKASITPATAINKVADSTFFTVGTVGASVLTWDLANPNGKSSVQGNALIATARFTGLPLENADFGTKTAKVSFKGVEQDSANYEVFFPKESRNHPAPDTGITPNWYHYWSLTAVPGYNRLNATYAYANGTPGDYARYNGSTIAPKYTIHGPASAGHEMYISGPIAGVDRKGIDTLAATLAHEKTHYQVDLNNLPGGIWFGKTDTDGDELPDDVEDLLGRGFDKSKASSFSPAFVYGDDEEAYCELQALGITGDATRDWANPGKQSKNRF